MLSLAINIPLTDPLNRYELTFHDSKFGSKTRKGMSSSVTSASWRIPRRQPRKSLPSASIQVPRPTIRAI